MIKVLFVINTLTSGGAEQALVNLVNNLNKDKYDISVLTLFEDGENSKKLDESIRYINKNRPAPRGISYIFRFFSPKRLYKFFVGNEHYDIIVSYLQGASIKVVSGCTDKNTKLISWIHNGNPKARCYFGYWHTKKGGLAAYKKMDVVVGVSKKVSKIFSSHTGIETKTLYNTNDFEKIKTLSKENCRTQIDNNKLSLCSVGTLKPEKGFDRLINISARLINEGYRIETFIAGKGSEKEKLEEQIKKLQVEDSVKLVGHLENPYPLMKSADIYVLSSRNEGLPLVVTEALLLGRPVVSTDVGGVRELLDESEYGLVVEDSEEGIYEGIKKMISDKDLMESYSVKSAESLISFYPEKTVAAVEELFDKLYEQTIN